MQYNRFVIEAFENKPGKWCARISRSEGTRLHFNGRWSACKAVTTTEVPTQAAALRVAMDLIDAGSVTVTDKSPIEKFWRRSRSVELRGAIRTNFAQAAGHCDASSSVRAKLSRASVR